MLVAEIGEAPVVEAVLFDPQLVVLLGTVAAAGGH